jgi:hypothetical protein
LEMGATGCFIGSGWNRVVVAEGGLICIAFTQFKSSPVK